MWNICSRFNVVGVALLFLPTALGPYSYAYERAQEETTEKDLRGACGRLLDFMAQEASRAESLPHDVPTRAALLGFDPARIYSYVQKEIRFEPYDGIQRGSPGVLVSGGGNSADKALLLMRLLQAGGFSARMVRGTLPPEAAERLLQAGLENRKAIPPAASWGPFGGGVPNRSKLDEVCKATGLAVEPWLRASQRGFGARADSWDEVLTVASREAEFLRSSTAGVTADALQIHSELLEAVRPHYWVQWTPPGKSEWEDLDPTFPGLSSGQTATASDGEISKLEDVADRFVVTLRLDRKEGEKRETVEILRTTVPIPLLLLNPLRLIIQPTGSPDLGKEFETREGAFQKLTSFTKFQALLMLGDQPFGSMAFDYNGVTSNVQADGKLKAAGEFGKSLERAFGGFDDPFLDDEEKKARAAEREKNKPTLLSLWADFEIQRGAKTTWSQRRGILEEGERPRWCPILTWNFFFQTHEISPAFVRAMKLTYPVRNAALLEALFDLGREEIGSLLRRPIYHYPLDLLDFCAARQAFLDARLDSASTLHFRKPNLFISGRQLKLSPAQKSYCACASFDIVENGALVLEAGKQYRVDRRRTADLGVFDTVLEQMLLRAANESEDVSGTLGFFERARAVGRPVRLVPAGDKENLAGAGVPETDVEWILHNMREEEYVLVAESKEETVAWWAFDPRTGQTVGRISGGRGGCEARIRQDHHEYAETLHLVHGWGMAFCFFGILHAIVGGHWEKAVAKIVICAMYSYIGGRYANSGGSLGARAATFIAAIEIWIGFLIAVG